MPPKEQNKNLANYDTDPENNADIETPIQIPPTTQPTIIPKIPPDKIAHLKGTTNSLLSGISQFLTSYWLPNLSTDPRWHGFQ